MPWLMADNYAYFGITIRLIRTIKMVGAMRLKAWRICARAHHDAMDLMIDGAVEPFPLPAAALSATHGRVIVDD